MAELDLDLLQGELDVPEHTVRWLAALEPAADVDGPELPDDDEAERLLDRLEVPREDHAEVLAARPDPQADKAYWWILDRLHRSFVPTIGKPVTTDGFRAWQLLTTNAGDAKARQLYLWAYLGLLPAVRRYHAERGVPDDVSWATLSLTFAIRTHKDVTGHNGLGLTHQWGPPIRLRGAFYKLGRLDFNRAELSFSNGPGGFALSVHIPPAGPLDKAAVEESIAAAREFFPRHYPDEPVTLFTCDSWLLDPQLADYLPAESNILAFQRRFTLTPRPHGDENGDGNAAIMRFVFGRQGSGENELDTLPQETTLHRAVVAHLRAGRQWHERTGWFPFEEAL